MEIAGALEDVGLPASLLDYADQEDFEFDAELRASHKEGIDKVGQEVGTPVIALPGDDGEQIAFFGPVVTPTPQGERPGCGTARCWSPRPPASADQADPHEGPGLQQPVRGTRSHSGSGILSGAGRTA